MVKLKKSLAKSKFLDNDQHIQDRAALLCKDKLITVFLVLFTHLLILGLMCWHSTYHLQSDFITLVNTFDMVEIQGSNQKSDVTGADKVPSSSSTVVSKIIKAKATQGKIASRSKKMTAAKPHMANHSTVKKYVSESVTASQSVTASHDREQREKSRYHNEQSEGKEAVDSSSSILAGSSTTSQTGHKDSKKAIKTNNDSLKEINRQASFVQVVKPIYPLQSKQNEEQGTVRLRVTVLANGKIANIRVIRSSGYARLDQAALDTVSKKYHFSPALRGGQPYMSDVEFNIKFVLKDI